MDNMNNKNILTLIQVAESRIRWDNLKLAPTT